MTLEIAKVFYRFGGGMEWYDVATTVRERGYFVDTELRTSCRDDGSVRSTERLLLADHEAIRGLKNWGCQVTVYRSYYPKEFMNLNPHVFYLPLNELYDKNPNLTELDVFDDLMRMVEPLVEAQVLTHQDFNLKVRFKREVWFAFVNFGPEMDVDRLAFVHRWLKENTWKLVDVPSKNVSLRYGIFQENK